MVDDELFGSDEENEEPVQLPLTKRARTRQTRQTETVVDTMQEMRASISNNSGPYTCQKVGCPSHGRNFKTKDGYTKHLR